MTQPEPTRDPRLLTAEQLATLDRLTAEYYRQGVGAVSHWTSIVVRDLLAHIAAQEFKLALREGECDGKAKLLAAQDQRHAALVEAAKVIVQEPDTYTQYLDRVEAVEEALAALAQPPGDEIRGD